MWNPFKKKDKNDAPETAGKESKKKSIEERLEKELDSLPAALKGKLKDPAVKKQFIDIAKRMEKDGVDFKSIRSMKKWMEAHKAEFKNQGDAPKVQTVVHEGPKIGRNDPCPCGSGKKYKKCCGADK